MEDAADEIRVPPVVREARTVRTEAAGNAACTVVVAVVVGGWLKDQTTRTLQPALRARGIRVASPEGLDDWKADIAGMARQAIAATQREGATQLRLALIGHSFGAQAVGNATVELAREGIYPAAVVLIDPVSTKPGIPRPIVVDTRFRAKGGVLHVFYRTFLLGPIRANIVDERGEFVATLDAGCRRISGTHNSICHCDEVVGELIRVVMGLR